MTTPYYSAGAGAPIIVQGKEVPKNPVLVEASTYNHHSQNDSTIGSVTQWSKGETQPKACRDVFWGLLFYAHIIGIVVMAARFGSEMASDMAGAYMDGNVYHEYGDNRFLRRFLEEEENVNNNNYSGQDDDFNITLQSILSVLFICGLSGFFLSSMALGFMMNFAGGLIKLALGFNIVVSGIIAIVSLATGVMPLAIVGILGFAFSIYYAYMVWSRIPFAAANLITAVTAVRANMGVAFYAYLALGCSFGWAVLWSISAVATNFVTNGCDASGECDSDANPFVIFLFLVSYFWTAQVIKNVVHVTVAGTVGTWWFHPEEAQSCCSAAVRDSYLRSITYSFGSICLGSLVVAIIQACKEMLHSLRDNGDSMILCCAECLLGCIESLVEYFNQWAFVFVGLYGYSFMEAGMNVMALFRSRGWTTIITDMLVDTVLFLVSIIVGILTGVVGLVVALTLNWNAAEASGAFVIGLLIGLVMSATLFGTVSSAVNTVIVCFAEAPAEFQANYPQLSEEMRAAWRQAYPVEFRY